MGLCGSLSVCTGMHKMAEKDGKRRRSQECMFVSVSRSLSPLQPPSHSQTPSPASCNVESLLVPVRPDRLSRYGESY